MRQGDLIVRVNGKEIRYLYQVQEEVRRGRVGGEVTFEVLRETSPGKWTSVKAEMRTVEMPEQL